MTTNYKKLHEAVLAASKSNDWDIAKTEWQFVGAYHDGSNRHCPCGHYIVEICQIFNQYTGEMLDVGNECVNQFDANLDNLGKYIIELSRKPDMNTKKQIIEFAFSEKIITDWEYKFSLDRIRKRSSTVAQETTRNKINNKIIENLFGPPCPSCKIGKIVEKSGKFGLFKACNKYPACNYTHKDN